jgi:tetratricopeptide (TPR) repeat protein
MPLPAIANLAPERFSFWRPTPGATVATGADALPVELPDFPLPIDRDTLAAGLPSDDAIGQGVYDYLRQFPDCPGNSVYAGLLRDAYPHYLADLAAHAVMLDAKQVEPAYVLRKLTYLKVLRLLEPHNRGLLWQLSRGYFDLALEFAELARCRQHLHDALRFGQEMLALDGNDLQALSLLAEVDLLLGDLPAATGKWQRLAALVTDPQTQSRIAARLTVSRGDLPTRPLVDELEAIAEAMQLHATGHAAAAVALLEQIEEQGQLPELCPSADFYCLLGQCRVAADDAAGAVMALQKALALEPDHPTALATLDAM